MHTFAISLRNNRTTPLYTFCRSTSGEGVCNYKEKSMRSKLVLAVIIFLSASPMFAQVAPAAKISGLPLGVGVGLTDFQTDYYKPNIPYWSGRMVGISAWGDYSIFHGLGVEVEARTIFADKPTPVARSGQKLYGDGLKETMAQGGIIYKYHPIFKIRPFVKAVGGIGRVQFPSLNPLY